MNMKSTSQHMNWGALVPAYVILGGSALLMLGGAQEISQNNGHPFGVALALLDDHLGHCVAEAATEGGEVSAAKLQEASAAIARLVR